MISVNIQDKLRESGMRITMPRVLVYTYLVENRIHPTCERIFRDLRKKTPNISLASVYNVTEKLCDAGLIQCIVDGAGERHYDADIGLHGHFFCEQCFEIYDVPCRESQFVDELPGSTIKSIAVTMHGICPRCNV